MGCHGPRFAINNRGVIVPEFRSTATLWLGNQVIELDRLVRADDPLKSFVHLDSAEQINDRGDIVALGFDPRAPAVRTTYRDWSTATPPPANMLRFASRVSCRGG
jgi:hypothetical protein